MHAFTFLLAAAVFQPDIPKTWTDASVAALEVPLANTKSTVHLPEADYYQIPARTLYGTYPVYHPGREPAGYREWLAQQEPQVAFDVSKLKTREDWVNAGELVFNAPVSFGPVFFSAQDVRDPEFYKKTGMPVAGDGTIPFARWVIRKKGQVELGSMGCNTCHTRVMNDGLVVPGAQGNNPGDRQGAWMLRRAAHAGDPDGKLLTRLRLFARQFETPWVPGDPNRRAQAMSFEELIAAGEAIPPGVTARSHTSLLVPPQIPDIIGVQERQYLDHTGVVRHRSIGDLMRYSTLVQDLIGFSRHGDSDVVPPGRPSARFSDEQLYALVLYLYSVKPPANPHRMDALATRGEQIFKREGCAACHTPPLYTNNQLLPVDGFEPPADHRKRFDILEKRIGTDPRYALQTRKGTGYYKVPSLKAVWYRSPLEHNGRVATLEDWFDASRLRDDYVPTGYKGYDGKARSVMGHEFGLNLKAAEKQALIAFLRTL
jgi:hypothetical protein